MSVGETLKKFFTGSTPEPVGAKEAKEQILGYDKDNLVEYRRTQEAEEMLRHANDKGFRKPSNKQLERAKEIVQNYRRTKAQTFLEEHKKRVTYFGVEIKAHFEEVKGTGLIKPSLIIADFNPWAGIKDMKPWSEALEENLATRINCTHEMNDDDTACKKCNLNPENWGSNNEGVSNDYQDKQRAKIAAEKERELACSRGEHVPNEETGEAEAGKYCVNCRKPKEMWEVPATEPAAERSPAAVE